MLNAIDTMINFMKFRMKHRKRNVYCIYQNYQLGYSFSFFKYVIRHDLSYLWPANQCVIVTWDNNTAAGWPRLRKTFFFSFVQNNLNLVLKRIVKEMKKSKHSLAEIEGASVGKRERERESDGERKKDANSRRGQIKVFRQIELR